MKNRRNTYTGISRQWKKDTKTGGIAIWCGGLLLCFFASTVLFKNTVDNHMQNVLHNPFLIIVADLIKIAVFITEHIVSI